MYNTNLEWLDEATNMRKDDLYDDDDLWEDEPTDEECSEEDEDEVESEEEYCEFCEEYDCEGTCQDSGWDDDEWGDDRYDYEEDPDEYWYGEDD
jgi:hypothetical protein